MNTNVPAAFMAASVDIVEGEDNLAFPASRAFKAAGGKIALAYTDPGLIPYCALPLNEPAGLCNTPMGQALANAPGAFLHDASGARINRYVNSHFLYQEMLNPASTAARSAYAQYVNGLVAAQPALDGVFADDSGDSFSNDFYSMSAPSSVEITSDAQYETAMNGMLAAAGTKVIYNGGAVNSGAGPAYSNGEFINQPEVIGQMIEGCFANGALRTDLYSRFQDDANQNLNVQAYHKLAVCMPTVSVDPASRLYSYAAFMLIYDPSYSVFGMNTVLSDNEAVYPETQLVPQQPLTTATNDVAVLRTGNVYVREFASCAIASSSIGGCAALVNSSSSSATIPKLSQAYAHSIVLDAQSLYGGGQAHVVAGTPSSLAPGSAAILVR
ncbi:MAG: putative glycoside hydrolase [Vulcanimicrobiaceae bacterium]